MYSQFLSADADGFLGSATIQEEDLAGLTLRNEANSDEWDDDDDPEEGWDAQDDEDWDDEDLDEDDDLDDEDWDDEDDGEAGDV